MSVTSIKRIISDRASSSRCSRSVDKVLNNLQSCSILFFFITALPSSNIGRSIPQLQYFAGNIFKYGASPNCPWRSTISAFPCILIPRGFQGLMLSRSSTTRATLAFPPSTFLYLIVSQLNIESKKFHRVRFSYTWSNRRRSRIRSSRVRLTRLCDSNSCQIPSSGSRNDRPSAVK